MSDSYFNDESDYSQENASDSEDFRSTYLQPCQFEPEKEKINGSHEKEKNTVTLPGLQQPIYQILGLEMWIGANTGIAKRK